MAIRLRFTASALAALGILTLSPTPASAQTCETGWQCKVNYGGTTAMDLYVPSAVAATPAVVVALHYCSGTSANAHSWFKSFADKYGFVIITPQAGGNCFDATPARSGERQAISQMVQYVVTQNKADTKRVFAAGASSGACMTQALLAAYPDVFAAGSSLAGVPAGAWTGGNAYGWTTPTSTTAAQWGDKVRQADSGFSGTRPRVQLWHGQGDTTLTYNPNFQACVGQWTNVFGITGNAPASTSVKPTGATDTWERTSYKDSAGTVVVEANSGPAAVPHDLTGRGLWTDVVRFFGLDSTSGTGGTGSGGASAGGQGNGGASTGGKANGGTTTGGAANGGAGGTTNTSKGGATAAGGTVAINSGGSQNGGATAVGGAQGSGGARGGAQNGGATSATGGVASPAGGALGNGGASSSGGSTSSAQNGGATSATGGSAASVGGATGNGGAANGSGGANALGGSVSGVGGATVVGTGGAPAEADGCSCRVAGAQGSGALGQLGALAAGLLMLTRRRRRTAGK